MSTGARIAYKKTPGTSSYQSTNDINGQTDRNGKERHEAEPLWGDVKMERFRKIFDSRCN